MKILLDTTKLLGFRIAATATGAKNSHKVAAKIGGKTGTKIGFKIGIKAS